MEKLKLFFRFAKYIIKRFVQKIAKIKIIISVILVVLFVFAVFSAVFDGIRVHNEKEPVFTVKAVSEEPLKITYTGLGYKVIRFPRVSEYEPFRNNIDVKFGTWFMKFELADTEEEHKLLEIVDLTTEMLVEYDDVIETFYEDDNYLYQFPYEKSIYVMARFKDGTQSTVTEALADGEITIGDLDNWQIEYIKTAK